MPRSKTHAPLSHGIVRDIDMGTVKFHPYLTKEHAIELASLLNRIETDRVAGLGGSRENGDGDFYTAVTMAKYNKY